MSVTNQLRGKYNYSFSSRLRKRIKCQLRALLTSKAKRYEFAMLGVQARLAKNPPLTSSELLRNRKTKRDELKKEVIDHYGAKCKCCGERNFGFLTLDHINGGGRTHRQRVGNNLYRWIRKNNFPGILQILCWNCNGSKGAYGVCAHKWGVP